MSRHGRTKLIPPKLEPEIQALETLEESDLPEPVLTVLDNEIECPRCSDVMELNSKFDSLVYFCDSCSLLLECV